MALVDQLVLDVFIGLLLADTVALVDQLALVMSYELGLADTVPLVDSVFLDVPGSVVFDGVDAVALGDALTFVAAYGELLVDAVPLADSLAFAQGHVLSLSDTVALADALETAIPITLSFADSVGARRLRAGHEHPAPVADRNPGGAETLAPAAESTLVLTPAPATARELVVAGGTTPSATPQPENVLDITPFAEGEH